MPASCFPLSEAHSGQARLERDGASGWRGCNCHASPDQFLQMILSFGDRLARADDRHWTATRPFTQRFHWCCAAAACQHAALAGLDGSRSSAAVAASAEVRFGQRTATTATAAKPRRRARSPSDSTILLNGTVFTAERSTPWAEAIAIRASRITHVGTSQDIAALAEPGTRVIDLGGRLVIPGFNDAHMHHTPDPEGIRLPVDPVQDPGFDSVAQLLCEAVAKSAAGTWIMAVIGERIINDPAVHREALDAITRDHPVILLGFTNHSNILNSAALARLGIRDGMPDPLGGAFQRYGGSQRLNGRIDEYAMWGPQRMFASMATVEEGVASLSRLAQDCARFGITTLQNMSWTPIDRYLDMLGAADFPIRMRLIHFPPSGPSGRLVEPAVQSRSERISVHGTKWILDGSPVERGAALGRPYADDPNTWGRLNFPPGVVRQMLRERAQAKEQLLLHAIGQETIEVVLEALEQERRESGADGTAVRVEHVDDANWSQLDRMKALNLAVAINPSHLMFSDIFRLRFGDGEHVGALRALLARDIDLSIGSDGPLTPFLGLFAAVTHPVNSHERISLSEALVAYTHGSARAEGLGDIKGCIAPGFLADIAVLSGDLFALEPDRWLEVESELTMVDGDIIHQAASAGF